MNKILLEIENRAVTVTPAHDGRVRGWQRWAPYAVVIWSLFYAALGIYWAVGGHGFPYTTESVSEGLGPLLGRFGPGVARIVVITAGMPAAAMGAAMLHGVRKFRSLVITAGALLAGIFLLLMTSLELLVKLGYTPYGIFLIFTDTRNGLKILESWTQWATIHQLLYLLGGFLWLAATVCYARRTGDACLYCGRRGRSDGWTSPDQAARWTRVAIYVAMVAPIFYIITRCAWALGFPLGMGEQQFRSGQESGKWIGGALFLGNFILLGAILMLGLVQRWGEVFPRWMLGLAGRRVPIALAVIPAALASVLLFVGGIGIWSGLGQMIANLMGGRADNTEVAGAILFQLGPTLLFPVWGMALAVATLGYYYRRRGPCDVCGRGTSSEFGEPSSKPQRGVS